MRYVPPFCFVELNPGARCLHYAQKWLWRGERCRLYRVRLGRFDSPYTGVVRPCEQCTRTLVKEATRARE